MTLTGWMAAFRISPTRWRLVVDCEGEAAVDVHTLTHASSGADWRLVSLADDGAQKAELPGAVLDGMARIPAGTGVRLFDLVAGQS